jgi:hypothetical protein
LAALSCAYYEQGGKGRTSTGTGQTAARTSSCYSPPTQGPGYELFRLLSVIGVQRGDVPD